MKALPILILVFTLVATSSNAQNSLAQLIGKSVFDEEVTAFKNTLGDYEVESFRNIRNVMFTAGGVELVFNAESEEVTGVFLMGPNNLWYTPYSGSLPDGLNWTMTRSQVEAKIGKGIKKYPYGERVVYQYREKHFEISYDTSDYTDMNASMKSILIAKEWD